LIQFGKKVDDKFKHEYDQMNSRIEPLKSLYIELGPKKKEFSELSISENSFKANRDKIKREIARLETKRKGLETKRTDLETKRTDLETKRTDLETKMKELETKMKEPETKMKEPETKMKELETEMKELETKRTELDTGWGELNTKITALKIKEKGRIIKKLEEQITTVLCELEFYMNKLTCIKSLETIEDATQKNARELFLVNMSNDCKSDSDPDWETE
jgi:chromosome segregation ATPase